MSTPHEDVAKAIVVANCGEDCTKFTHYHVDDPDETATAAIEALREGVDPGDIASIIAEHTGEMVTDDVADEILKLVLGPPVPKA